MGNSSATYWLAYVHTLYELLLLNVGSWLFEYFWKFSCKDQLGSPYEFTLNKSFWSDLNINTIYRRTGAKEQLISLKMKTLEISRKVSAVFRNFSKNKVWLERSFPYWLGEIEKVFDRE